jgi:hypothetical protein
MARQLQRRGGGPAPVGAPSSSWRASSPGAGAKRSSSSARRSTGCPRCAPPCWKRSTLQKPGVSYHSYQLSQSSTVAGSRGLSRPWRATAWGVMPSAILSRAAQRSVRAPRGADRGHDGVPVRSAASPSGYEFGAGPSHPPFCRAAKPHPTLTDSVCQNSLGDVVWAGGSRKAHEVAMAYDPHRGRQVRLAVGAE